MSKKFFIIGIQCVFLLCPILWLMFKVDYKSVGEVFKLFSLSLILFLAILLFVRFILQSIRFWSLITPFTDKISMLQFILLDWKARYYAIIMPSSAGQDITRAVLLKNHLSMGEILAISVFFRATGVIMLVFISIFGFFRLYSEQGVSTAIIFVGFVFLVTCAILAMFFSEKTTKKLFSILPKKTPRKVIDFLESSSQAILLYKKYPKLIVFNLFFSFVLHFMWIFFLIISIYAICGEFKFIETITFIPPIEILVSAIPFAPSGVGIREGLMILFFNAINLTKEQAFSYITLSIMLYLIPFLGIFVILFDKIFNRKS